MSIASRIERIRALAEHPRTPDEERDTARRYLARLQAAVEENVTPGAIYRREYGRWYGAKHGEVAHLTLTDIAKRIRTDIKMARQQAMKDPAAPGDLKTVDPIGDAPDQIKFGVRTQYYAGGGSIDITVKNIPADWGFTTVDDQWGRNREVPTEALRALAKALKEISNAYNYDGSDVQTDYFDKRFYGGVSDESGLCLA